METGPAQPEQAASRAHRAMAPSSGDSLRKREEACAALRSQHKKQRISKKRSDEARKQTTHTIDLCYINARGINSRKKQEEISKLICGKAPIEILALSETQLTSRMHLGGCSSIQSSLSRSGGCWVGGPAGTTKNIKTLGTAITWMATAVDGVPVHLICCYFAPGCRAKTEESLARLIHMIQSLRAKWPSSRLILMGDFNDRVREVEDFMAAQGIPPIIPTDAPTHKLGGHLDQVFTNLPVNHWEMSPVAYSDHYLLRAQLTLQYSPNDVDLYHMIPEITQAALRRAACSEATAERMRTTQGRLISVKARGLYADQLKASFGRIRWYQQPSRPELERIKSRATGTTTNSGPTMEVASDQNWRDCLKALHEHLKHNDLKSFYSLATRMTKIRIKHDPVRALINDQGETLHEKVAIEALLAKYYTDMNPPVQSQAKEGMVRPQMGNLFTKADLIEAIEHTNFEKAIGEDGFDGRILESNPDLKERIADELAGALNSGTLPDYLRVGRLVPLSKKRGDQAVTTDDVRPIVVKSHIAKVAEKAILSKLTKVHPHILRTSFFQRGFKEEASTADNLTRVLQMSKSAMKKSQTYLRLMLFVDLKKAYDRVDRSKLLSVLNSRCQNAEDTQLVYLISCMHLEQSLMIGDHEVKTFFGVAQGSVLSPVLFNVYLEAAIESDQLLSHLARRGDLLAYADDMAFFFQSEHEAIMAVAAIEKLDQGWNIKINKSKSEFLVKPGSPRASDSAQIAGIICSVKVKYLGMYISLDKTQLIKDTKAAIRKNLGAIKGRLRGAEPAVKEQLLMSHVKSLLVYFGTPLVASGFWKETAIEAIEKELFKELMLLPNDVNRDVVVNILRQGRPSCQVVARLATHILQRLKRQRRITEYSQKQLPESQVTKPRQQRIYIPKMLAETIIAVSRNSTCINYGHRHICLQHGCTVSINHLHDCLQLEHRDDVSKIIAHLKADNIRNWRANELSEAILVFARIHLHIHQEEISGRWQRVTPQSVQASVGDIEMQDASYEQHITDPMQVKAQLGPPSQPKQRGRPRKAQPAPQSSGTLLHYFRQ